MAGIYGIMCKITVANEFNEDLQNNNNNKKFSKVEIGSNYYFLLNNREFLLPCIKVCE